MRKAIFLLSLLLLQVVAEAQARRLEHTPMVGYRFKGGFTADNDLVIRNRAVSADEGASFGAFFDAPLTESWQLEILANRQNSSFIVDEGLFTPEQNLGDVTI